VDVACRQVGLDPRDAWLIHHYANVVFHLPVEGAVARVARSSGRPEAAQTAVEVTRWLVDEHGFPATRPLPGLPAIPVTDDVVVTFWTHYPQPSPAPEPTSADLGSLIRRLHDLPPPQVELPPWRPLTSLETTVRSAQPTAVFTEQDQVWVLEQIRQVRAGLDGLEWSLGYGLIHGDAWAGNLLTDVVSGPPRFVLGDWDAVAYGPREVDLAPTWHAASRYGRGHDWADDFAEAYGYDLTNWPGHGLLMQLRDLMQLTGPLRRATPGSLYERALQQRLTGIQACSSGVWQPLTGA
jgi:hypothetical protein